MTAMLKPFLVAALLGFQNVLAAQISITPTNFTGIVPAAANISCVPSNIGKIAKKIVGIKIQKEGKGLVSLSEGSKIGSDKALPNEVKVRGHIDADFDKSFLQISNVLMEDVDTVKYTCLVYYIDDTGFVMEDRDEDVLVLEDVDLKPHVTSLFKKMIIQEAINERQESRLAELDTRLKGLGAQLKIKEKMIANLMISSRTQTKLLKDLRIKGSKLGDRVSAFTMGHSRYKYTYNTYNRVIFDVAVLNEGGNYDTKTGAYKAPTKGIYAFHLTIMIPLKSEMQISVLVNRKVVGRILSNTIIGYDQKSFSLVVKLEQGDVVSLIVNHVSTPGMRMLGYPFSAFSGYLMNVL